MEARCKEFRLAVMFPARAVAVGCLFVVLVESGVSVVGDREEWVREITSGKVEFVDFEEVVDELRGL
jgi:hypothetical protein